MKRRLLALLLVLAMVLSMAPMGVLAEEAGSSDDTSEYGASSTYVNATARVDFWTQVSVEGYVSEWDRRGVTELTVVAAAFDYQQMLDSAYVTVPMEDVEDGSFTAALQLTQTYDQNSEIQIFLLDQDLQPVCSNIVYAEWEQALEGLDGDIQWSLSYGTLTLNGFFGLLSEMTPGYHEWDNYSSRVERIVTYDVQNISDSAFKDYENLYSVELGEGIETIGAYAFADDSNVTSVTLPASVKTIGDYAFDGISQWAWIDIAEGFDWDNVTIGPGNDAIEAWRPTVDPDDDLIEIPEPTESGEEETLEATEPTEETVPETTEETVPEETKTQDEEETDYSDYYIAPEGAQLQEDAVLEELAAYTGTDKAGKGYHTATFTGLVPLQLYFFIASRNPGSLEKDDLQAIGLFASDGEGKLSLTYVPKEETGCLVQLYGPETLTFEVNQDHVTLHPGESFQFTFTSNYDADVWSDMESDRFDLLENEDGTWTLTAGSAPDLKECETTYLEFIANNRMQTVRTRVRVDLVPAQTTVNKVTLGQTKLTRNIYDSEATQIPILLDLEYPVTQNEVNGIATFSAEKAEVGRLVQNVTFSSATDAAAKSLFQVTVQDDYTLLLSTAEGVDLTNAATVKAIKSSYKMGFHLEFVDGTALDTGVLTLAVQKKLPTVKANTVTLNPYYNATEYVTFTGGNVQAFVDVVTPVSGIEVQAAEDGIVAVGLTAAPAKAASKSLAIRVMVEGYSIPVKVTVPVKLDVKAPTAKLETTSWTIARHEWDNIWIPVQWTSKNINTEDMEFGTPTVRDSKGKVCDYYTAFLSEDGRLYLGTKDGDIRPAGKETLSIVVPVSAKDARKDEYGAPLATANLTFKVTVTNLDTVVKLAKSSITLNAVDLDNVEALVGLDVTRGGEKLSLDDMIFYYNLGCSNEKFADSLLDMFNVQIYSDGAVGFQVNLPYLEQSGFDFDEVLAATYTFTVDVVGDDSESDTWAGLTIHLTQDATELTGLKATGTIDRIDNQSFVTLSATYQNSWGNRVPGVKVTDSKGNDCTELFTWSYDYNTDTIHLSANPAENDPDVGKYTVTLTNYSLGVTTSKSATFTVKASKPTVKVTGKVDGLLGTSATVTTNYRRLDADGLLTWPDVTLYTTGKKPAEVDESLYDLYGDSDTGALRIEAAKYGSQLLAAGKYTLRMTYDDGTVLSAPITVTQTAAAFKLSKSSTTLHPRFGSSVWLGVSMTNADLYTGNAGVEYYQSNGKTLWANQNLIKVELDPANGNVTVTPTGAEPAKDTTVKVKLYPDTRIPGKFTWLTVKVLGGKNLTQKITLKAAKSLDPSYNFITTDLQCTLKGFDNYYMEGTVKLLVSRDKGKTYQEAADYYGYAYGTHGYLDVDAVDPSLKYRVQVTYYCENGTVAATGTADLKVAFGSNKFTVAKAPTLYKQNAYEPMDIHLNAKSLSQRIDHIVIKGKTDFTISKSAIYPESDISGSQYDWVLRYTGTNPAKLKTTTLTLQIFLKGNTTAKPNATTTVKITVK